MELTPTLSNQDGVVLRALNVSSPNLGRATEFPDTNFVVFLISSRRMPEQQA